MSESQARHVLIIGGGFAGVACAKQLAGAEGVRATLFDKNGFHQFQPLLYQVATAELTPGDIAFDLDEMFADADNIEVRTEEVATCDPRRHTVTLASGEVIEGDIMVIAAGAQPNFFHTPGADEFAFPLYSLSDAERVRSRILQIFEDVEANPRLIDAGALNFVVVGAGATGVEIAGALAELVHDVMPLRYSKTDVSAARVIIVDLGNAPLGAFSKDAHRYATRQLDRRGVTLTLGSSCTEVARDHVTLSNGDVIKTHLTVWGGGEMAAPVVASSGLPFGHGGRVNVGLDFAVKGFPDVYAVGDAANIPAAGGGVLPQLGSVAQQAGQRLGWNIAAEANGEEPEPFRYHDKGIMAMIGRRAAVAEIGEHRHELHGRVAFAAWLGVHAMLLSNISAEVKAFMSWAEDFYVRPHHRSAELLDPASINTPRIRWAEAKGDSARPGRGGGPANAGSSPGAKADNLKSREREPNPTPSHEIRQTHS
jgi:NADH:quinone reductase (non-electrogenic)